MITTFRHKALAALFLNDDCSGLQQSQVRRLRIILQLLHAAHVIGDMDRPGFNLHPLQGDRQGYWAVKVDGNHRIVFRFEDGNVSEVELIDYH
ncbi:MAG: type II toxin-antitoxin system RelE/ParE family toxin [Caldilineaceae bacterium]|nr:type II toxin-antitoxin system RelE/ParE family toxin [Caldilineaceae bacterium]